MSCQRGDAHIASAQEITDRVRRERAQAETTAELSRRYQRATDVTEEIQRALLPNRLPVLPAVDLSAAYVIGGVEQAAGGDWFDVVTCEDGRVALVVGDVVGHGVGAAATMSHLRAVTLDRLFAGDPIDAVIHALDRYVGRVPAGRSATVCIALLDPVTGEFEYVSAGNPPPFIAETGAGSMFLEPTGDPPLGFEPPERRTVNASLGPNQVLVLYTDGLIERPGVDPSAATIELLQLASNAVANRIMPLTAPRLAVDRVTTQLIERLTRFTGVADDITILAAGRKDPLPDLHHHLDPSPHAASEAREVFDRWLESTALDLTALHEIGQVVTELVDNAREHSGASQVSISAHHDTDGVVTITVADNGAWKAQRPTRGRGIGLPLARQLADDLTTTTAEHGTTVTAHFTPWRSVSRTTTSPAILDDHGFDSALHGDRTSTTTLWIRGALDGRTLPMLQPNLTLCLSPLHGDLIIDMNEVTILASTGIHALREFINRFCTDDRTVTFVVRPGTPAHRALVLAGLLNTPPDQLDLPGH